MVLRPMRHSKRRRLRAPASFAALLAAFALLAPGVPARAQDDGDGTPVAADPGVARISLVRGDLAVRRADTGDSYAAVVNAPLAVGDYVLAQPDARGELEFDYGVALRIDGGTQLRFTDLRPQAHRVQLAEGTVDLRLFRGLAAHPEIETPAATIRPSGNGSFRITVTDTGDTVVTARAGRVTVTTASGTQALEPGPSMLVTGDPANPQVATIDPVPADAFDAFNRQRDAAVERARDWAYVDAGFVGADDLDAYGTWTDVAGYGTVWQPNDVPDGWAPYHTGRWVWEPYYGWTWVDTAPWGYAPYHYGRWFYANDGWYWAPGIAVAGPVTYAAPVVVYARPVFYRPALVAFFSFGGGGFAGAAGFANIGWCPLAPNEAYHPWYGPGSTSVNVSVNVGIGLASYRNARAPGGAVAVSSGAFASGNYAHVSAVQRADLALAAPARGVVPVVPTSSSLAFKAHGASLATAGAGTAFSPRFAHFKTQPKTTSAPFAEQQRAVQAATIKTYPEHAAQFAHPASPVLPGTTPVKPAATADPFSRFDRSPDRTPDRATGVPHVTPTAPSGERTLPAATIRPSFATPPPAFKPTVVPTVRPDIVPPTARPNPLAPPHNTPKPYVKPHPAKTPTPKP